MRVWIETVQPDNIVVANGVTLRVRVWIETLIIYLSSG